MKSSSRMIAILVLAVAFVFATTTVTFARGWWWGPQQVKVVNSEDYPVPVFDVDTELCRREVLTARVSGFTNVAKLTFDDDFPDSKVPDGQILVIETVSVSMQLPLNERPLGPTRLVYELRLSSSDAALSVPLTFISTDPTPNFPVPESYAASYKVKIYVRSGEVISVLSGALQTDGIFSFQFMGYLVSEACPRP